MGEVVQFRRARLGGFIQPDNGSDFWSQRHRDEERARRDRLIDLIGFAKKGAPIVPDDCA